MRRLLAIPIALFLFTGVVRADERAAIAEVSGAIMRAWNEGNAEAMLKHFARDAQGFGTDGSILQGFDVPSANELFESGYRVQLRLIPGTVRVLGDVAWTGSYLRGTIAVPGEGVQQGVWRATAVWVKEEGRWKLAHWHHSPLISEVRTMRPEGPMRPDEQRRGMMRERHMQREHEEREHAMRDRRMREHRERPEMMERREREERPEMPGGVVVIRHRIEDWDRWAAAFKDHAPTRAEFGSVGSHVWRSADDPNDVVIALQVKSLDLAERFVRSEDLKEVMTQAGVVSEPDIWMISGGNIRKASETGELEEENIPKTALFVHHKVENMDKWLEVFQHDGEARAEAGSKGGFALMRPDAGDVLVFLFWDDIDRARAFASSDRLREKMASGGVIGKPDILFLKSAMEMER